MTKPALRYASVIASLLLVGACTSRYRMDLFMTAAETTTKVKVESTEFVRDAVITDPFAESKLLIGEGNCLILNLGARGERLDVGKSHLVQYDESFHCRLYVQLSSVVTTGTVELRDNSFVHVQGRYELPSEMKVYLAADGTLVVDSLVEDKLYGTIDCDYQNRNADTLNINGRFKVKIAH